MDLLTELKLLHDQCRSSPLAVHDLGVGARI